jgi:hypothetical protein
MKKNTKPVGALRGGEKDAFPGEILKGKDIIVPKHNHMLLSIQLCLRRTSCLLWYHLLPNL